jgi:hypothetical protein
VIKKLGVVTIGVSAALVAAAPFASATESHHGHDGHHKDSGSCNVNGGGAEANGGIDGDAFAGNLLAQAPIGGNNILNITCNDILNDNLSGNDVAVAVLGDAVPGIPG